MLQRGGRQKPGCGFNLRTGSPLWNIKKDQSINHAWSFSETRQGNISWTFHNSVSVTIYLLIMWFGLFQYSWNLRDVVRGAFKHWTSHLNKLYDACKHTPQRTARSCSWVSNLLQQKIKACYQSVGTCFSSPWMWSSLCSLILALFLKSCKSGLQYSQQKVHVWLSGYIFS